MSSALAYEASRQALSSIRYEAETAKIERGLPLGRSPYVVLGRLGEGGMGEVYEVEHARLGSRFAAKVLHERHRGRADLEVRLLREARLLAAIRHPRVVAVVDVDHLPDGRPFFVMDRLAGNDLCAEVARSGLPPASVALEWIAQALDGLAALHAAGLVHRDVKLSNLHLDDAGAITVIDLGAAQAGVRGGRASGLAIGTPRSMAPEQQAGGPVDARTDVYGAGLALYDLLAGRGPFDDRLGDADAMRRAHATIEPPPPSRLAPRRVSPGVDAAVQRALAKAPADRYASAAVMARALRALSLAEGSGATEVDLPPLPWAEALAGADTTLASETTTRVDAPPTARARAAFTVLA
jgi:serine/threonine protein kinase